MNKIEIKFLLVFLLFTECSLDSKSGLWTDAEKIDEIQKIKVKRIFKKKKL